MSESEEYNLKQSVKGLGQLLPIVRDAKGRIADGFHREQEDKNWWSVTNPNIKTDQDLELARLAANFCRRRVLASEMMQRIGFLIESGLKPEEICEKTGISRTTVYKYMPQELKQESKVHVGPLANQTVKTQESIECEGCGISTSEPEPWNHPQTGPHNLCKECHRKATLNPDPYMAKFRKHLEIERKLTPNGDGTTTVEKVQDTWAYRESKMHPETSEMEEYILQKFSESEYRPVQHHREIVLTAAYPDFYLSDRNVIFELDGPPHEGKEEKDSRIADLMEKRTGATVHQIAYKSKTQEEKARVWNEIVKILENGKA